MPCMEVWGGNQAVDCGVVMSGLDAWLYARPYRGGAGGGDVHYVSSCATGRVTRVLVADVAGHGEEAAETGARLRQLMRRYVNHLDQTRFVVSLNNEFTALGETGRFATSVVATFFAPTNYLVVCNAGHPPPLWYRRRLGRWQTIEPPERPDEDLANLPLGILDRGDYVQQGVQLRVGDLVLCYTDSLTEASDEGGRLLGTDGLRRIVETLDPAQPDRLIAALLESLSSRHAGNLAGDDLTVLLFRPNGLAPRVPWRDRVRAPFRVLGGVLRALRRRGDPPPLPELSVPSIGGAFFGPLNRRWGRGRAHATPPGAMGQRS